MMEKRPEAASPFAVLNPGGRDRTRLFPDGAGSPDDPGHPPVNYHAYAACCRGGFYRADADIPEGVRAVLVLLRKNGLKATFAAVKELKKRGKRVFVSWKESGLHQIAESLGDWRRHEKFRTICAEADGFISSTPELISLYQSAGCRAGEFVPTPYPVGETNWDFSLPVSQRRGVFVGTREFAVPSRNHHLAVTAACGLGSPVTVINTGGAAGERLLRAISPDLTIVRGPLSYVEYLRLMARHRLVFQLDRSAVPGQVAGDALLCRVPCVGGDGAVDRLAFANLSGFGREPAELIEIAKKLLGDSKLYAAEIEEGRVAALRRLGFSVVRAEIEKLLR